MQMMDGNSEAISEAKWLREKKVQHLMLEKRRLVEAPYTASLADTLNALVANRVSAVPVAAPPGQYIGAGGSMIMESDKITGAVRRHFIAMVTMLDVIAYIAEQLSENSDQIFDLDKRMSVPVSSIIGHSLESLCLWTLNPNTSLLDCMEVFCRCIHRALVPVEGHVKENITGVEFAGSATSYRMLTLMDILLFFKANAVEMEKILSRPVGELGAIALYVFGVTNRTKAIDAINCMATVSLQAVPIVEASEDTQEDRKQLIDGKGRNLIGTFSATDLREYPISLLQSWLPLDVMEFTEKVSTARVGASGYSPRELVTCYPDTSLGEVIEMAVNGHVHRVWVVDEQRLLIGIVSLTDILRMIRVSLASLET